MHIRFLVAVFCNDTAFSYEAGHEKTYLMFPTTDRPAFKALEAGLFMKVSCQLLVK